MKLNTLWATLFLLAVSGQAATVNSTATVSLGTGSAQPGGTAAIAVSLAADAIAKPVTVQWTMTYSASDVSSVAVTAGTALVAAGKSVTCRTASGSTTCVAYGLNRNVISNGVLANTALTLSPGAATLLIPIAVSGVVVTDSSGGATITGLASGGSVSLVQSTNFSLSGTLGASGAGATVSLQSGLTTTADASGNYIFSGLVNGSYTVTPTKANVTFTPVNRTVTVSGANQSGINFTATVAPTWSISGALGASGSAAIVSLIGSSAASTTADASGNYAFSGLANGSYTVTPTKAGVLFTPTSKSVTVNGANQTGISFTSQAVLVSGLLAGYGFEGTTADSSGSGLTGTLQGATWTTAGHSGKAASFNGSGYIDLGASALQLTSSATWSAWVFPTGNPSNDGQIIAKSGNSDGWQLKTTPDTGVRTFGVAVSNGSRHTQRYSRTVLALNTWYHVAGVYNASTLTLDIYVNGQLDNGVLVGTVPAAQNNPTSINANIGRRTGGYYFSGTIDDVRVYGRALSLAEVQADMNSPVDTQADTVPPTTPVGVSALATSSSQITLNWTASTDNVGVVKYLVERCQGSGCTNFAEIAAPTAAPFSDSALTAGTTYSYRVRAADAASNFSAYSSTATATTSPAAILTWTISGSVGTTGAGALITLSGLSSASTTADASGSYAFSGLANGSYTVTPTKANYTFTPVNRAVTVNGANQSGITFTATAQTWSISGTLGTAGSAATVSLSGPSAASTTADASGNYIFSGLANGSYTVTPAKVNFSFTPVNRAVTVNGASQSGINFTATAAATWTISGALGATGSGAAVSLSGPSSASTTADTSGNYTFAGLVNGTYTVTPTKANVTFTPTNMAVTISGANQSGINFTSKATTVVSGLLAGYGFAEGRGTTTADSSGNGLTGTLNGATWTAGHSGQATSFNGSSYIDLGASALQLTSSATWSAWVFPTGDPRDDGQIIAKSSNSDGWQLKTTPDTGVRTFGVAVWNGSSRSRTQRYSKTIVSLNKWYHVAGVYNAAARTLDIYVNGQLDNGVLSGTVPAAQSSPASINANIGRRSGGSGYYFIGTIDDVRGYGRALSLTEVQADMNSPVDRAADADVDPPTTPEGVSAVAISSSEIALNWTESTDNVGVFRYLVERCQGSGCTTFAQLGASTTVTLNDSPLVAGTSYSYRVRAADTAGNLSQYSATATAITPSASTSTWTISGSVGTAGAGSVIRLTGAAASNATADASGNYTFSGLANGSYTVTPTKANYTFSPVNRAVTVSGANQAGINFTATATVQTWSISGTLGASGSAATVSLTGTSSASTTADASGNYAFSGLANGSYTVTPAKASYTFTPASKTVSISGANQSAVDFTATAGTSTPLSADVTVTAYTTAPATSLSTPPFSTAFSNEIVLAFVSTGNSGQISTTVSAVSGGGLRWTLVARENRLLGTSEIWRAFSPGVMTNTVVSASFGQNLQAALTVVTFRGADTSGTDGSGAIGAVKAEIGVSGTASATLVTTRKSSLVFGVGNAYGIPAARSVPAGQSIVSQRLTAPNDTFWVQRLQAGAPAAGSTVTLSSTSSISAVYNFAICEILPASGTASPALAPTVSSLTESAPGLRLVNIGSGKEEDACSPGGLAALQGQQFTSGAGDRADSSPLPYTLEGLSSTINGSPAPLLSVSPTQVTFQCPAVAPGDPLKIEVRTGEGKEYSLQTQMKEAAPSLLASAFISSTGEPVSNNIGEASVGRSALAGEDVTIVASGLGEVLGAGPALGQAAPLDQSLATRNTVQVVMGGRVIDALQSNLAPGAVGLYQVRFRIPADLRQDSETPVYLLVTLPDGTQIASNSIALPVTGAASE